MKTLGKMLCEARITQQMTQEMLANHLNVARTTVSNWERDEAQPDFYMLRCISDLLHYDFFAVDRNTAANQEGLYRSKTQFLLVRDISDSSFSFCLDCGSGKYCDTLGQSQQRNPQAGEADGVL